LRGAPAPGLGLAVLALTAGAVGAASVDVAEDVEAGPIVEVAGLDRGRFGVDAGREGACVVE
jgi:hypothetical protein